MDQPLERFNIQEMLRELRNAEITNRMADFRGKLLPEFSFSKKEINTSIDFSGSTIQGAAYFYDCKIKGKIIFENTLFYRTLYIADSRLKDDLILKTSTIRENINFNSSIFLENIILDESTVKGFLGMNKVKVKKDININYAIIKDIENKIGTIKGDLYIRNSEIDGSINAEGIYAEGLANFENSIIHQDLNLKKAIFNGIVILSGTVVEGGIETNEMKSEKLIAHMI